MGDLIGLMAVIMPFGIAGLAIWSGHQRRMVEMGASLGQGNDSIRRELESLRQEISSLRDTTTRYDMSFDTALQRMESRLTSMEDRVAKVEQQSVRLGS